MDPRTAALDLVAALAVGTSTYGLHVGWYTLLEQSIAVDVLGSVVVGVATAVAHAAVTGRLAATPRRIGAFFAVGFGAHLLLTPSFTPTDLGPAGVNAVLFAVGASVAIASRRPWTASPAANR